MKLLFTLFHWYNYLKGGGCMQKEKAKEKLKFAMVILALSGNKDNEIFDAIDYAIDLIDKQEEHP